MKSLQNDTAVLFFSRSGREESRYKSLISGKKSTINQKLCKRLVSGTKKLIGKSGLPNYYISTPDQYGQGFGERFTNAIQSVFDNGYTNVIAVGNDCPLLTVEDLTDASKKLNIGQEVLGPTKDGGIYLLGISKEHFDKKDFQNLNWQSSLLLSDIQQYFVKKKGEICFLDVKQDVNSEQDLLDLFEVCADIEIIQKLREIYFKKSIFRTGTYIDSEFISRFHQSLGLRGPPRLSH